MGVGGQRHAPAALPPGMTRYPLYRRLGRPPRRFRRVLKIWRPPGFDPMTVQLVASRYTDCAIPAPVHNKSVHNRVYSKSLNSINRSDFVVDVVCTAM
jgi:hypothetical protein